MSHALDNNYEINQSPFYCLRSKKRLAKLLHVSLETIKIVTRSEDLYREREVQLKTGKIRGVEEPKPILKRLQKRIEELLKRIKIPEYIHGPAKGRSHITNAKAHRNAAVVRSIDIQKYFASTSSKMVYAFFHNTMKCSPDVAGILTKLSTFKEHLPTGSPLSPILSYFTHIDMWNAIHKIAKDAGCTLTVYMDDVTISGERVSGELIWKIKKQFRIYGLRDNKKKEKYYLGEIPREITGLIVSKNGLTITNRHHHKHYLTRKSLHQEKNPDEQAKLMQSLEGLEAYKKQIHKANLT